MPRNQKDFTYDNATRLNDLGAITASAGGTVASVARVLDLGGSGAGMLGGGPSRIDARVIIDIAAISVGNTDQLYTVEMQVSNDITFASGVFVANAQRFGHPTATGLTTATVIGRYEMAFTTELNGVIYRYGRTFSRIAGTTPSISYAAYLAVEY